MKRSMIVGVTNEDVVHPENIKTKLEHTRSVIEKQLADDNDNFTDSDCPACQSTEHSHAFDMHTFHYHQCDSCQSVFMTPRPNIEHLKTYYNDSEYAAFLKSETYKSSMSTFSKQLVRHRADQIVINNQQIENSHGRILLYSPKSSELKTILDTNPKLNISTMPAFSQNKKDHHDTGEFDLIAAFDIFERLIDPISSLKLLFSSLKVGGRLILTLRSGSGFDLLTLWENIDLVPVEHMNLMTVEGISKLMDNCNIEVQEISTPGQLDVQIVERIKTDKDLEINRFASYLINSRDQFTKNEFQQFLQRGLLSSHLYLVGTKK